VGVDDLELVGRGQRARQQLGLAEHIGADLTVERPFHVLGRHRRAVVEFRVLPQLEGDFQPVGADSPAFCEFAMEIVEVEDPFAVELLLAEGKQPVIGQERQTEGFARRARDIGVERVDRSARDMPQRFRAGLGECRKRRRGEQSGAKPPGLHEGHDRSSGHRMRR